MYEDHCSRKGITAVSSVEPMPARASTHTKASARNEINGQGNSHKRATSVLAIGYAGAAKQVCRFFSEVIQHHTTKTSSPQD